MSSALPADLDLALIAQLFPLDAQALQDDLQEVFTSRATRDLAPNLPPPPAEWGRPYRQLAVEVGLDGDLRIGHTAAARMLDTVLEGMVQGGTWNPEEQRWDR